MPINGVLRYNVGGRNAIWLNDTYAVMLSETQNDIESFNTTLIEENLSSPIRSNVGSKDKDLSNEVWFDREIDLKAYEGKEVYIAFRHYKSENEFCVVLDNVSVVGEDPNAVTPSFTYNVYRDEELIKNTDNLNFVETLDSPGSYLYEVEVLYEDGQVSPKVGKLVNVQEPSQTAYVRLQAHDVWLDGTGYQILLDKSASLYGSLIPAIGPLTYNCNVFYLNPSPFSHSVPENADISCSPYNWIVNGKSELVPIPAGTYDYCITNPNPGSMIYIASSEFGRGDDFVFEAGKIYTFKARMNPENPDLGDFIELTVESSFAPVVSLESTTNAAGDVTLNWLAPESKRAVVVDENFENSMPSDWTTIDADGDGNNWLVGPDLGYMGVDGPGSFCVRSASWDEEPLTPNNYLVTPKLNLTEGGRLSFWVCAQDASWPEDHYAVYASTSGNEVADFTELLFEETVAAKSGSYSDKSLVSKGEAKVQGTWRNRVVELPAGTNYVAFRHFNSVNVFWLLIDDVRITDDLGNQDCSYTIYRDGEEIATGITETTYTQTAVTEGDYVYCVKAVYESGESDQVCIDTHVDLSQDLAPVSNLQGSVSDDAVVKLSWDAPAIKSLVQVDELKAGKKNQTINSQEFTLRQEFTYNVLRDGVSIASSLTSTNYEDANVEDGLHEYCVQVQYVDALSPNVCIELAVESNQVFAPVTNLVLSQNLPNTQDVSISWDAPTRTKATLIDEDFQNGIPMGWTLIDADGDGHDWVINQELGYPGIDGVNTYCARSASYANFVGPLTPDNYLVTPELDLPQGGVLIYWVSVASNEDPNEHYSVVASMDSPTLNNLQTVLFEETMVAKKEMAANGKLGPGNWYERKVILPSGTKHIAFRHFNSSNQFWLKLDNVKITNESEQNDADYTYTIFRDDVILKDGLTAASYIDQDVEAGSHKYGVQVAYPNGQSEIVEAHIAVLTSMEESVVIKPYTLTVYGDCIYANANGDLSIYDIRGRLLAKAKNSLQYRASTGVYIISIQAEGTEYVEKISLVRE